MVLEQNRGQAGSRVPSSLPAAIAPPSLGDSLARPRIVTKPWGQELIFAHTAEYAGKILYVTAGHRLSLQYHERKHETVYVRRGLINATIATSGGRMRQVKLYPGDMLDVPAGRVHRFEALEDSEIFEVSTPELDDIVRLSDDYGR
jgi:mannose-6-phosphate isomerase-like protein (cupin superfamily)